MALALALAGCESDSLTGANGIAIRNDMASRVVVRFNPASQDGQALTSGSATLLAHTQGLLERGAWRGTLGIFTLSCQKLGDASITGTPTLVVVGADGSVAVTPGADLAAYLNSSTPTVQDQERCE